MSTRDGGFSEDGVTAAGLGRHGCPTKVGEKKQEIVGVRGIYQEFLLSSGLE